MYKFYNANSLGKFENDCTIRSISCAENESWDNTYIKLSELARRNGTMMDDKDFIRWYLDTNYIRIDDDLELIGEVANKYRDNVMLITTNNHITCSKFGTIYDTYDTRFKEVEYIWLVR